MDEVTSIYQVKAGNFEGPLDVLLSLIEKRKLHISEVSLSEVTEEYIEYVQGRIADNLHDVTAFVALASTLLLIKSRMLIDNNLEADTEVKLAAGELERRLHLLNTLRKAIKQIEQRGFNSFLQKDRRELGESHFIPHDSVNTNTMFESIKNVITALPKIVKLPAVEIIKVMSLEQMTNKMTDIFKNFRSGVSFKKVALESLSSNMSEKEVRVSMIVSFLAMLELVHSGILNVMQEGTYNDIICEPVTINI